MFSMFSGDKLQKPKIKSLALTLVVAAASFYVLQVSAVGGFLLAILLLLMFAVIFFVDYPMWPIKKKAENPILFSLIWGLMIGILLPFVLTEYVVPFFASI